MRTNSKILGVIAVIFLVIVGLFWYMQQNINTPDDTISADRQEITLNGSYVCLPHRDTNGPETMECALGMQAENGMYYGLDTSNLSTGVATAFTMGDAIRVQGFLTPADELTTDGRVLQYDVEGVIEVMEMTEQEDQVSLNEETHSIAGITFSRPEDFGLAVSQDQLLVESVIPPCDEGFEYCLYYIDTAYEQTNFESAGVRIVRRSDLTTEDACLSTAPAGYTSLTPDITNADTYATSMFSPLQNAGAGHSSTGKMYRLFNDSTCFEFETRIGTTQLGTYEPGAVEEFTDENRQEVVRELDAIIEAIRFTETPDEPIFSLEN